jgi:pimeloyl-ACP methyl ester carboxylesterase
VDLRRPGAARRVIEAMRAAHTRRKELRRLLDRIEVPVTIVAGSEDPVAGDRPFAEIEGAGHYPQLTHPEELARVLRAAGGRARLEPSRSARS